MGKVRIAGLVGVVNVSAAVREVNFLTVLITNTSLSARSYRVAGLCYRDL